MRLFYSPYIETLDFLSEEESNHCAKVLRLKSGDIIFITDGKGKLFTTRIKEIHPKRTAIEVVNVQSEFGKRPYYAHIAIAPTKNIDRIEWFVEKATEIGIDEITPILCKNSERKVIKIDRLNRIVESAMKQSYKAYHPKINEMTPLKNFLSENNIVEHKFIAHCEENEKKKYLGAEIQKKSSCLILIGPEGDFTSEEINLAEKNNFVSISLGTSRLRTETAGIVACDLISIINQI